MAPGRWARGDRPTGLTCCPAGGAPQEGEGQPQQHGVWLRVSRVLEKKTGHPPLSEGPPTSPGSMALGGEPRLTWLAEAQAQSWLRESCTTHGARHPALYTLPGPVGPQPEGRSRVTREPKGGWAVGALPGAPQCHPSAVRTWCACCRGPVAARTIWDGTVTAFLRHPVSV